MLSAATTIQIVTADLKRARTRISEGATVKRETSYYLANIKSIKTSKDFVNNYRLFTYAMKAYGLSDMAYAKTFMQKIIDGGLSNPKSMANHLSDPRFKAFAKAFDFGDHSVAATTSDINNSATTANYLDQALEDDVGQQNEGARVALYFLHQAPNITNGYQILGNKALFRFVQTAFDIPAASTTTLDRTSKLIESKLHISDLKDPEKVKNIVRRFASLWDLKSFTEDANTQGIQSSTMTTGNGTTILPLVQSRYSQF
jgi:Protein of unknown function (DUF1217)